MKKIILVAALLGGVVALAADVTATEFVSYDSASSGTSPAMPVSATQGIPLNVKGKPIQYITVTMQPIWDAGQGYHVTKTAVRAWRYSPNRQLGCSFDGGTTCITNYDGGAAFAWSRYPSMDFSYNTDSGSPYVQSGPGGISFSGALVGQPWVAPAFMGNRIYYSVDGITVADAGTDCIGKILLEGAY